MCEAISKAARDCQGWWPSAGSGMVGSGAMAALTCNQPVDGDNGSRKCCKDCRQEAHTKLMSMCAAGGLGFRRSVWWVLLGGWRTTIRRTGRGFQIGGGWFASASFGFQNLSLLDKTFCVFTIRAANTLANYPGSHPCSWMGMSFVVEGADRVDVVVALALVDSVDYEVI